MALFLKHFFSFTFLFLLVLLGLDFGLSEWVKSKPILSAPSHPTHVLIGNSHPECAFNDKLIEGLHNFGRSDEYYFFTFQKIDELLAQNPSVHTVFIELSKSQMIQQSDSVISSDKGLNVHYTTLSSVMNYSDMLLLLSRNPGAFPNAFSVGFRRKLEIASGPDIFFEKEFGGYLYLDRFKTDSLLSALSSKDKKPSKTLKISTLNLGYLRKIIDLCKSENKRVILIRSPFHEKHTSSVSDPKFHEVRETLFGDVEFMDFANFKLSNAEFGDLSHLNYRGAARFSRWIDQCLKDGLLEETDIEKAAYEKVAAWNSVFDEGKVD